MTETQIRSVAVFFYYSLPHELLAMEATEKALKRISKLQKKTNLEFESLAVSVCNKMAKQLLGKYSKSKEKLDSRAFPQKFLSLQEGIIKHSQLSLGPWKQFLRDVDSEELFLLIWVHILDFDRNRVAIASEITTGTLQYRVSRLLKSLGNCLIPGSERKDFVGVPHA